MDALIDACRTLRVRAASPCRLARLLRAAHDAGCQRAGLDHPNRLAEGRRRIVKEICTYDDGRRTERVDQALKPFMVECGLLPGAEPTGTHMEARCG